MFDRYTERARRVIFFARYEASACGASVIKAEHMLLGLLREDPVLRSSLSAGAAEAIGELVRSRPEVGERVPTTVDMPLDNESKRALAFAAEEATRLGHGYIDCGHLVLGLLRIEKSLAADSLRQFGVDPDTYREIVRGTASEDLPTRQAEPVMEWYESEASEAAAPSLSPAVGALRDLMERTVSHLAYREAYGERMLKRREWTRKQAVGHLVDWAATHQQWFARALTEPKLQASGYPADDWVAAQGYDNFSWEAVVDLWVGLNRLIVHVLARVPESKVGMPCRIGLNEPIPLSQLVSGYVDHCGELVAQILAHL